MRVLFLALGATRRRAVVEESRAVAARGGAATVLVARPAVWSRETFDDAVTVIDLSRLQADHAPQAASRKIVVGLPRKLFRLVGRGPLAPRLNRWRKGYERRVAATIQRKIVIPAYGRIWHNSRAQLLVREIGPDAAFDAVVISDPASLAVAERLVQTWPSSWGEVPPLCFSVDHLADQAVNR